MKQLGKIFRVILMASGIIGLVMMILAFTTVPFWTWYGMASKNAGIHRPPEVIVLMGGGGMPSESGLIRIWYAAKAANWFTRSKVIIALPGDTADSLSSVSQMKSELVLRGVAPERIFFEDSGTNTRAQAINIWNRITEFQSNKVTKSQGHRVTGSQSHKNASIPKLSIINYQLSILIVTSPEHLYRSVLAFKKAGFLKVDGLPAFEQAIESDISFNARKLGGRKMIPDIGDNIALRYQFWTQLHYELLIVREWFALGYYKLMGWI